MKAFAIEMTFCFHLKKKVHSVYETEMRPVEAELRSKIGWAPFS